MIPYRELPKSWVESFITPRDRRATYTPAVDGIDAEPASTKRPVKRKTSSKNEGES